MKKIILASLCTLLSVGAIPLFGDASKEHSSCFSSQFTAGYVFKYDDRFKAVYGQGMVNAITADFCYYPWEVWGVGAKLSYWRAKGCTTFLKQRTLAQELPFTFYLRRRKLFACGLQLYGSLGGGFAWIKEKSYLGTVQEYKGVGEVELGLQSPTWHHLNLTAAVRYLFPPQCLNGDSANVGGVDLRAGIGLSF